MENTVFRDSLTSAASLYLLSDVSNLVMGAIPFFPMHTDSQKADALLPTGVTAPIPVTTTRFMCYQAKNACVAVSTACATGTTAVGEAFRAIRHGYAVAAICGGSEAAITPV